MSGTKYSFWPIAIGCVLLILSTFPLFSSTIPGSADGFAHKFRLASFHTSLNEGTIRPRWIGDLALGYGGPLFLFNYSLPYYIADVFYRIGFSINTSGQLFLASTVIASWISMFLYVKNRWGNWSAIIAASTYTFAPYHLLTVYSYEAWGEALAYVFPPLIVLFLHKKLYRFATIAWICFILTHNISSYITSPILILLAWNKKTVQAFFIAVLLSAFHWLPAIYLTDTIKINELFQKEIGMRFAFFKPLLVQIMTNIQVLKTGFVQYYEFTIGIPILVALLASFFTRKKNGFIWSTIAALGVALFFADPISDLFYTIRPVQFVLYPYRWLFVATFAGSILTGFLFQKTTLRSFFYLAIVIVCGLPFTKPHLDTFAFDTHYFFQPQPIRYALPTLKSMGSIEFLPKNLSMDFLFTQEQEYLNNSHSTPIKIAEAKNLIVGHEFLSATIENTQQSQITINTAYYPNWKATIDSQETAITKDAVGRMQISVPGGTHTVQLHFSYSPIEKIGFLISFVGLIIFLL